MCNAIRRLWNSFSSVYKGLVTFSRSSEILSGYSILLLGLKARTRKTQDAVHLASRNSFVPLTIRMQESLIGCSFPGPIKNDFGAS